MGQAFSSLINKLSGRKTPFSKLLSKHASLPLSNGISLETPGDHHFQSWKDARRAQIAYLQPWEPKWQTGEFTKASFDERVRQALTHLSQYKGLNYFLIHPEDEVIGAVNLFNVRMGASKSAFIGYWLSQHHCGHGYMSEAVETLCVHGFNTIGLARIEASCLPDNLPSKKLLERCGFQQEGLCRSFLEINGRREDHLIYSRLKTDPKKD